MVRGTHRRRNAIFAHILPGQSHMVGAHPLDLAALEAEDPELHAALATDPDKIQLDMKMR